MKKLKKILPFIILVIFLIATGVVLFLRHVSSNPSFGEVVESNIAVNRCNSEQDGSRKCFNLKGTAYVVSTDDTEKIADKLAGVVRSKHLTDNKKFKLADGKTVAEKTQQLLTSDSAGNDPRIAGTVITLFYSGGLFGEYTFPYNNSGHALYVSASAYGGKSSDSDGLYAIKSEFGGNDTQAQAILEKAKTLPKTQYILLVAQ